ncbi:MAG: amidophosphoribosyltransferase [Patescibacteria group bacterium]
MGNPDKPLLEKCGIVGVYSGDYQHLAPIAIQAASGVQHRGQHGAGFAYLTRKGLKSFKQDGLIKDVFVPSVIRKLDEPQLWSLVHCRYGTSGDYSTNNIQPCIANTRDGSYITVVHNGEFVAVDKMIDRAGVEFDEGTSDTYIFTRMLAAMEGDSWREKIKEAVKTTKGAYSLMIAVDNELFVTRDSHGIRPLFLGKLNGYWVIASETHAFYKIGATFEREVACGEIVHFTPNYVSTIQTEPKAKRHFCDFEWAYFARPNSRFSRMMNGTPETDEEELLSVYAFREICGQTMASEAPIPHADLVVGIPDSGMAIAAGYAKGSGVPLSQLIIRDHFDTSGSSRLFMRDDEKTQIGSKVLGKLSIIPDRYLWKDKVVVLCDDSIVRGNVSHKITQAIFALGAREVHWMIGFPPVRHRCHLGVSIRTHDELIAVKHNGDTKKIAEEIGATSISYISHSGFIQARTKDGVIHEVDDPDDIFLRNGGCGGCVTGKYPVNRKGKELAYE